MTIQATVNGTPAQGKQYLIVQQRQNLARKMTRVGLNSPMRAAGSSAASGKGVQPGPGNGKQGVGGVGPSGRAIKR